MKKFIYIIILTLSAFALVGCAADAPQAELDERSEYASYTNGEQQTDALELLEENNAEQDVTAYEVSGYSINPRLFGALRASPSEVEALFGEYVESAWWEGYLHRFGDTWISGFDVASDGSLSGTVFIVFGDLPDLIDGLTDVVEVHKLDELFGGRISYYVITGNCIQRYWFGIGAMYLLYEYKDFEIQIRIPPDTNAASTRVEMRDRIPGAWDIFCMYCHDGMYDLPPGVSPPTM